MEKQSGREFASTDPPKGAQDAALQKPRLSPEIPINACSRIQHLQRPTPPHIGPNASHLPCCGDEHVARRSRGCLKLTRRRPLAFFVRQRVLQRQSPKRLTFGNFDRLVFATLYRLAPRILNALAIVEPETVIRWHRAGFCLLWRWKSRSRGGRPKVALEIRQLIREMSLANPLWGAPRIHGELLKLGIDVGQTSVAKYMTRRRRPPSQGWKTFLRNHADGIASIDLFVVPTISFRLLYGLLILQYD